MSGLNSSGVQAYSQSGSVTNFAAGGYTGDGSGSIQVFVGFTPRYVKVWDITDATQWEWSENFPATNTWKTVTGGTQTVDTGSLIVTNCDVVSVTEVEVEGSPGQQGPGEGNQGTISITYDSPNPATPQLTFASGLNTSAKVYAWVAYG